MSDEFNVLDHIVLSCKANNNLEEAKQFLNIVSNNSKELIVLDRAGFLQSEIKDYKNCINTLKKCLEVARNPAEKFAIRANMAKMCNHINDPMVSLAYSKINQSEQFDYDTQMEMAFSYYLLGNYEQSEKMMRELITHTDLPDNVRGRVEYNLGSYDIEHGQFKKGLKGFIDVGHKIKIWPERLIPNVPVWKGEDISGKTLVIHAEGGIGDELINVRFVNNLKQLGANPIWITNSKDLEVVFNRNGIETKLPAKPDNVVQCMAMYLPILLDLDKDKLWTGAYLKPSQEYVDKWKNILPAGKKLAVKWSGNPHYDQDLHRSIPLEHINNIQYDGTKINLQLEPSLYQENMFNAGKHITNIEDTLAILSLCDDLVTSCTSIVHMNGALGKNGIVCPPIASYYVWLGSEGKSDWYDDSLKVVRQKNHKDWKFVETVLMEIM